MTNFYITISPGLLRDRHRQRMQVNQKTSGVWLYLWLLDKVTKIDKETGYGFVLGGKPIKTEEIDLGYDIKTIRKILKKLESEGYLITRRTPYGKIIYITKCKKKFGYKIDDLGIEVREGKSGHSGEEQSGHSLSTKKQQSGHSPDNNLVTLESESGHSNKISQLDNTVDNNTNVLQPYGRKDINECFNFLKNKLGGSPDGSQKENRKFAKLLLDRFKNDYPDRPPEKMVCALIEFGLKDNYHGKNITSFKYLFYNTQKIIQSIKQQKNNSKLITI